MSEDKKKSDSKLSLSAKADKFDVSLSTLKKVYKRGVAAWNSGHRPGTTPQQWGHARVNSFLRKGKTYHTADKDLRESRQPLKYFTPMTPEEENEYNTLLDMHLAKGLSREEAEDAIALSTGLGKLPLGGGGLVNVRWTDGHNDSAQQNANPGTYTIGTFVNPSVTQRVDAASGRTDTAKQRINIRDTSITRKNPKDPVTGRPHNVLGHENQHALVSQFTSGLGYGTTQPSTGDDFKDYMNNPNERVSFVAGDIYARPPSERKKTPWTRVAREVMQQMDTATNEPESGNANAENALNVVAYTEPNFDNSGNYKGVRVTIGSENPPPPPPPPPPPAPDADEPPPPPPPPKYGERGAGENKGKFWTGSSWKKPSEMSDEERYGKTGAAIRRLDPEAYKKRDKTAAGNLQLLKKLSIREFASVKSNVNQLNELKKETMQSYLEKRPSVKIKDVIAARAAEKAGDENPIYRLAKIQKGRRRAQNKINKIDAQAAAAERQRKIASGEITAADLEREHLNLHHPYAPRVPGVPDKPGSRYWGDHVEHDTDINQLFERLIFTDADEGQIQSARQMQSTGAKKEDIWKKTGAFQHPQTGRWLQEPISDDKMEFYGFKQQGPLSDLGIGAKPQQSDWNTAANVMKHDQLFKKFPGLSGLPTIARSLTPGQALSTPQRGRFTSWGGRSTGGIQVMSPTESGAKDAMVHELQHAVQFMQGRDAGASPQQFKNQGSGNFMSKVKYYIDPGENEARAAAARRILTPQQRKERYPGKDFGIANIFEDEQLDEMQLVGTDEYRQHAIAMTPGQNQEIEDAFPPEVYGAAVPQGSMEQEETETAEKESSDELGSENNESDGASFRKIRKQLQEQPVEEVPEEEVEEEEIEDEEELEDDGAEDGVDFTPSLKTRKIKNRTGNEYAGDSVSGFPVLGLSEGEVIPVNFKGYQQLKKHPAFDPNKKIGLNPNGDVWQKLNWNKPPPKAPEGKKVGFFTTIGGKPPQTPFLQPKPKETPKTAPAAKGPKLSVVPTSPLLNKITGAVNRNTGKAGTTLALVGAADKARSGDLSGAAADVGAEAGGRILARTAGKSLLKKLPFVGLGLGAADAVSRARAGDFAGAGISAASGLASMAPGLGTAAAVGLEGINLARDLNKQKSTKKKPTAPPKKPVKEEIILNEAIDYHVQNNLSLVENVYRPGSEMFFAMILEAKRLYAEGKYTPKDEYEQDLLESDIGEVAEYNGELVLLDYPYEDMEECWKGYTQKGMKKKGNKMVPNCVPMEEENDPTKGKGIGKPFRSRGGGAVYVRNEKGNVIKVNFSQSGMKKRFNEPARVKSFVARHNCYGNKDKTSASYWACRWPRYFSDSGQKWW